MCRKYLKLNKYCTRNEQPSDLALGPRKTEKTTIIKPTALNTI